MAQKKFRPHIPYRDDLKEKSRSLRVNSTPAEKAFWNALRTHSMNQEFRFTRQKPLGNYIVDFYCQALGLVIELDGDTHYGKEAEAQDRKRTEFLESQELKVLRFTNEDVMHRLEGVFKLLEEEVKKRKP